MVWKLRANPEFDLDTVRPEELPGTFTTDGQPNFSYEKGREILKIVENNTKGLPFQPGQNLQW